MKTWYTKYPEGAAATGRGRVLSGLWGPVSFPGRLCCTSVGRGLLRPGWDWLPLLLSAQFPPLWCLLHLLPLWESHDLLIIPIQHLEEGMAQARDSLGFLLPLLLSQNIPEPHSSNILLYTVLCTQSVSFIPNRLQIFLKNKNKLRECNSLEKKGEFQLACRWEVMLWRSEGTQVGREHAEAWKREIRKRKRLREEVSAQWWEAPFWKVRQIIFLRFHI